MKNKNETKGAGQPAPWQYFSKLYLKWIDAKPTDCKESLKEYHYEIRETPKAEV